MAVDVGKANSYHLFTFSAWPSKRLMKFSLQVGHCPNWKHLNSFDFSKTANEALLVRLFMSRV